MNTTTTRMRDLAGSGHRSSVGAVVGAVLAAVALGACGDDNGSGENQAADAVAMNVKTSEGVGAARPARFEMLPPKWRQFDDGVKPMTPRGASTETIATSWPYKQAPHGPAGELPKGGTIVSVALVRRAQGGRPSRALCDGGPPFPKYPNIAHHPLVLPATPNGSLEGRPNVPEYRVFRTVRKEYTVELRVNINQPTPSSSSLTTAQEVVDTLHLPRWPTRC